MRRSLWERWRRGRQSSIHTAFLCEAAVTIPPEVRAVSMHTLLFSLVDRNLAPHSGDGARWRLSSSLQVLSLPPLHLQSSAPASLRPHSPSAPELYQAPHTHRWLPLAPGAGDPSGAAASSEPSPPPLARGSPRLQALLPQAPRRPPPFRFILGWTCFAHP